MTEQLGITRYNCTVGDCRGEFGDCMEKSRTGRWVTFEQHMRQVKHLQREIERLTAGKERMAESLAGGRFLMQEVACKYGDEFGVGTGMKVAEFIKHSGQILEIKVDPKFVTLEDI